MNKRVVVTGLGVISSIGQGKDEFWKNLIAGRSGISKIDAFDTSEHTTHYGGQVKDFNPEKFLSKKKIRLMGRASLLGIAATKLAIKDTGLKLNDLDPFRTAVLFGTTAGEAQEIERIDSKWVKKGKDAVDLWSILQYPVNNISSNVARELKIKGLNRMFTTACSAGNYAIGYGFDLIQLGKADYIVAGGSDSFSYLSFTGFNQVRAVSPDICRPFDKNRKGIIPGEGSGVLILETLESAKKRGAHIYAEILGYGLSCDAYHMTQPNLEGISRCMETVLCGVGLKPEDIDYICAHGTGTRYNDRVESKAINKVFNQRKVAVSSLKSMLGHTMGAASAIEALACCKAIEEGIIPPTINHETPDPDCDIDCVPNQARQQKVNTILNNGFAFGGNNCSLALKKLC